MTGPLVEFPSVEMWATAYLRDAIADYGYPSVSVGVIRTSGDQVTVRRDGGPTLDVVREAARLGVNVWASTEKAADDMARRVSALLRAAADGDPVVRVVQTMGPSPVADAAGPRRYMTFECWVRGDSLTA